MYSSTLAGSRMPSSSTLAYRAVHLPLNSEFGSRMGMKLLAKAKDRPWETEPATRSSGMVWIPRDRRSRVLSPGTLSSSTGR